MPEDDDDKWFFPSTEIYELHEVVVGTCSILSLFLSSDVTCCESYTRMNVTVVCNPFSFPFAKIHGRWIHISHPDDPHFRTKKIEMSFLSFPLLLLLYFRNDPDEIRRHHHHHLMSKRLPLKQSRGKKRRIMMTMILILMLASSETNCPQELYSVLSFRLLPLYPYFSITKDYNNI